MPSREGPAVASEDRAVSGYRFEIEARGPVTADAFLAQRHRPGERARLALQEIEVVVEFRARAVLARQPLITSLPGPQANRRMRRRPVVWAAPG